MSDPETRPSSRVSTIWSTLDVPDLAAFGLFAAIVLRVIAGLIGVIWSDPRFSSQGIWDTLYRATSWATSWDAGLFALLIALIAWWKLEFQFSFEVDAVDASLTTARIATLSATAIVAAGIELAVLVGNTVSISFIYGDTSAQFVTSTIVYALAISVISLAAVIMALRTLASVSTINGRLLAREETDE